MVNAIGKEGLGHLLSVANVLHAKNPLDVEDDWIKEYSLEQGNFDITLVNKELVSEVPNATQMGKVYQKLIVDTMQPKEDYADGILRIYNDDICDVINDYNCSAYYEPSYVIVRAYQAGGF